MMNNNKPVILIFIGYYLPGYRAGGPVKSVANLVEQLSEYYTFKIVTRDRDLGDSLQYPNLAINEWQVIGKNFVYYLDPAIFNWNRMFKIIKNTEYDVLYLNSFFDFKFTFLPLFAAKVVKTRVRKIILAPRGEFSYAALDIKHLQKVLYISILKVTGILNNVVFQASTELEKSDITKMFLLPQYKTLVASNLPSKIIPPCLVDLKPIDFTLLKIIFLSRISQMKNLIYALEILHQVERHVQFDIYGPIEDLFYWNQCLKLIDGLPNNIMVRYEGSLPSSQVSNTLMSYDLLFLPSMGENYCHVVAEALAVGTPVLISNNTPWKNLENDHIGWDINLKDGFKFKAIIEGFKLNKENQYFNRVRIVQNAAYRITNIKHLADNIELFKV